MGGNETLDRLRSGEATVALALLESDTDWGLERCEARLGTDGSGYRLSAEKVGVQHADRADLLLVLSHTAGAVTAALVTSDAEGIEVVRENRMTRRRAMPDVHCQGRGTRSLSGDSTFR